MGLQIVNQEIHHFFDQISEGVNGQVQGTDREQRLLIPAHLGKGSITRTKIRPDMEVIVTDLLYERDVTMHIQEVCQLFELSYCLQGDIHCEWAGKTSETNQQTGNVLFLEDVLVREQMKGGIPIKMLELRLSPQELLRYAADLSEQQRMESWLQRHKGNIDRYPDTQAIHKCATELMHCPYSGAMKRLYLESKALEFIALFGEASGQEGADDSSFLRRDDVNKLQQARELVALHYEQPLSIRELARRVGLNEFKLKKGFRDLYGMTVFELVRQKRMEKALWHMEVEGLNVGETAASVGYSNASNFATTFRKYYGCNPSVYGK